MDWLKRTQKPLSMEIQTHLRLLSGVMVAQVVMIVLFNVQTPEVLELSKEIKEKLKEADQYGIIITINAM